MNLSELLTVLDDIHERHADDPVMTLVQAGWHVLSDIVVDDDRILLRFEPLT